MKKLDEVLLKVFLYGLPGVILLAVFAGVHDAGGAAGAASGAGARVLNISLGSVFCLWILLCLWLGVRLMVSGFLRDRVLARLAFMKERDEREVALTGEASKKTLLMTLAVLIFLFFLSCLQVSVFRLPPEKAVSGKTGTLTLGFGFSLLEGPKGAKQDVEVRGKDIFSYTGLPVSSTAVILLLIVGQIGLYNYSMRRLMR